MNINDNVKTTHGQNITLGQRVRVTETCYDLDVWCAGSLENVKPGEYKTIMREFDEDDWGIRVGTVEIWHESVEPDYDHLVETDITVGVDSGQAGFADYDYYAAIWNNGEHEDFYFDKCVTFGHVDVPLTPEDIDKLEKFEALSKPYIEAMARHFENPEDKALEEKANTILKQWTDIERDLADNHRIYFPTTAHVHQTKQQFAHFIATPDCKSVFTSSGYGDGSYTCYVKYDDKGRIVGALIDFLYILDDTP